MIASSIYLDVRTVNLLKWSAKIERQKSGIPELLIEISNRQQLIRNDVPTVGKKEVSITYGVLSIACSNNVAY